MLDKPSFSQAASPDPSMNFLSDNAAPVCPQLFEAMAAINHIDRPYDQDAASQALDAAFSKLFGTWVSALWIATGTAANAIGLATICPPHGAVVCHREAHIQNDECGAPEFYMHGGKLMLVDGEGGKITPDAAAAVIDAQKRGVHASLASALSIGNATEYGLAYRPDEVAALGDFARRRGLRFHMDGARFANAVAHLGCDPADVTWRAGVDVLSFGFTKNGGMSAEALIFFDPALADVARYRRKRGGHLLSKGRYLAAQLLAMLEADLWLDNARAANAVAARLAAPLGKRLVRAVEANEVFVALRAQEAASLRAQGFAFHDNDPGHYRFVTHWAQPLSDADQLAAAIGMLDSGAVSRGHRR